MPIAEVEAEATVPEVQLERVQCHARTITLPIIDDKQILGFVFLVLQCWRIFW
jgi:hypothetical protein